MPKRNVKNNDKCIKLCPLKVNSLTGSFLSRLHLVSASPFMSRQMQITRQRCPVDMPHCRWRWRGLRPSYESLRPPSKVCTYLKQKKLAHPFVCFLYLALAILREQRKLKECIPHAQFIRRSSHYGVVSPRSVGDVAKMSHFCRRCVAVASARQQKSEGDARVVETIPV